MLSKYSILWVRHVALLSIIRIKTSKKYAWMRDTCVLVFSHGTMLSHSLSALFCCICLENILYRHQWTADVNHHSGFYWSKRWWDGSGISWTICKWCAFCSRLITMPTPYHSVFVVRRYGSMVYAIALCLVQVEVLLKRLNGLSWFLAWRPISTYPTLCSKEIHVTSKIRVLPSGTLSKMLDLENFVAAASHASVLSITTTTGSSLYSLGHIDLVHATNTLVVYTQRASYRPCVTQFICNSWCQLVLRCSSCHPTNSVKALKTHLLTFKQVFFIWNSQHNKN